ncbi:hypothetical protein [Gemmobacter serpentinus]|uniref:hypothetical protein n=1 Tax=Gemmobacter serpentinus TaxID=2652247 RepID=UPI00124D6A6A|nr:hypothetical protein [Gemmobacter serpentinus]
MKRIFNSFLKRDDGAVTVDFVVITAAIVIMALGVIVVIVNEGVLQGTLLAQLVGTFLRS